MLFFIIIVTSNNTLSSAFDKVAHTFSKVIIIMYIKCYKSNAFIPNSALDVTSKVIILLNIRY